MEVLPRGFKPLTASLPDNETSRLAALRDLELVHTPATPDFDAIVEAAAEMFECPISLVSLVEEDIQWFKANCGLDAEETKRDVAFCAHAILTDDLLIVPDASKDSRFKDSALVTGEPHIRFYAGCPLSIDGVHRLGTLCVIDTKPRLPTDAQCRQLRRLGTAVEGLIRAHKSARKSELTTRGAVQQEQRFRRHANLLEQVANVSGVGGWEADLVDRQTYWSTQTKRIHDLPDDYEPVFGEALDSYAPEAQPIIRKAFDIGIATGQGWDLELPFITSKGREIWIRVVGEPVRENGQVRRIVGALQDITQRKQLESKLVESERLANEKTEELEVTLANMKQGVSVFDGDAKLLLWNQNYIDIFNKPDGEIYEGVSFLDLIEAEKARGEIDGDPATMIKELRERLNAGETVSTQYRTRGGRVISMTQAPMPGGGWVGTHDDITAQVEASTRVLHAAQHDTLTGLVNRSLFNIEFEKAAEAARNGEKDSALMLIDLDRFKPVNDTFGHAIGDQLLKTVARRLLSNVKSTDLVARLGGDEFAVVCRSCENSQQELSSVAARIVESLATPFSIGRNRIEIGASVGVSLISREDCDVETVLAHADSALYKVKQSGRGGYRFVDGQIRNEISQRNRREVALRDATRNREFILHFQPMKALGDCSLIGYEALIRWVRPQRKTMLPLEFIPIAEETGLIREIGNWALNTALEEAVNWSDQSRICLNISPRQLGNGLLFEEVERALTRWDIHPSRLELDVTEDIFVDGGDESGLDDLHKLKTLGVAIALDNFGTGNSSLNDLRRFPFDRLKIDRSIVAEFENDSQCAAIVIAVANLAKSLGIETTAEGIETAEQMSLLKITGCTIGQGYYLGHPVPADQITDRSNKQDTRYRAKSPAGS